MKLKGTRCFVVQLVRTREKYVQISELFKGNGSGVLLTEASQHDGEITVFGQIEESHESRVRLARARTHLPLLYVLLFDRGCYKRLSLDDIESASEKLLTFPRAKKKKKQYFIANNYSFFLYIYMYIMKSRARRS